MIALSRSAAAREATPAACCCSNEPIWKSMVFDMAPNQSTGVVGSPRSDPTLFAREIACNSSEFAR